MNISALRLAVGLSVGEGTFARAVGVRVNVFGGGIVAVATRTCASFADVDAERVGAKPNAQKAIRKKVVG
jgi:hypothetical protein